MNKPKFNADVSLGNLLTILTLAVAGVAVYGDDQRWKENVELRLSQIERTNSASFEKRISILEMQRADDKSDTVERLGRIESKVDRIEIKLDEKADKKR